MYTITVDAFKAFFPRQFTYGDTLPAVSDAEIQKEINEASTVFNFGLYPQDAQGGDTIGQGALYYLTAHFLQTYLDAANSQGQPDAQQSARAAGGISESLVVPEWMTEGVFSMFATTAYGRRFLLLTKPYLDGGVFAVGGRTQV